jgi:diketogulonate reductase-like aldo/keto reductase
MLNNGVRMPLLAVGTAGIDNETVESAMHNATLVGYTHFHTAFDYYNLPGVARGLANLPRDSVFVTGMTSPCIHTAAPPLRNVSDPRVCHDLTQQEIRSSLSLLGLRYFDLLLLHGPSENFGYEGACNATICELNQAQWRAYQEAVSAGHARAIGVSNFCESCLSCLLSSSPSVRPAVNQLQWHVGMGPDPEGLISFCASADIVVQAYSPLAAGAVVSDPLCIRTAQRYNRTAAQVGLRWLVQQPAQKAGIVVKAAAVAFLQEDREIFDWVLSAADMAVLDTATEPKGQQDGRPSWGCAK